MRQIASTLCLGLCASCASIVSDSTYPVSLDSNPSSTSFVVRDRDGVALHSGYTPALVQLEADSGYFSSARYQVTFERAGYADQVVELTGELDAWYWGNLLFGGLSGFFLVDPVTGAMWELDERVSVVLQRASN